MGLIITIGAGERAQWLGIFAALPEDLSFVPTTHFRQHTTSCNFIYTGYYALS